MSLPGRCMWWEQQLVSVGDYRGGVMAVDVRSGTLVIFDTKNSNSVSGVSFLKDARLLASCHLHFSRESGIMSVIRDTHM